MTSSGQKSVGNGIRNVPIVERIITCKHTTYLVELETAPDSYLIIASSSAPEKFKRWAKEYLGPSHYKSLEKKSLDPTATRDKAIKEFQELVSI